MPSLADVYVALSAQLSGDPPEQSIDLWAASADPALVDLRPLLGRFRISTTYQLRTVSLSSGRSEVVLIGRGSFALPEGPASDVEATLVSSEGDGGVAFALALAMVKPGWTFLDTFPVLADSLVSSGGAALSPGPSFMVHPAPLGLGTPVLAGRSDRAALTLSGTLDPDGALSAFKSWIADWPLALEGDLSLPETQSPPAFDLKATAPGQVISLGLLSLREPGFRLLSLLDGHDVVGVDAYSQLDFTATLEVMPGVTAQLSGPLLLAGRAWALVATFEADQPRLSRGVTSIAELFGVDSAALDLPPGIPVLDAFRVASVEVWMPRSVVAANSLPTRVDSIAITVVSREAWHPPIPRLTIASVGTRWVVDRETIDTEFGPALAGSAFGTIEIATESDPAILDVVATFPQYSLSAGMRENSPPIPIGKAFEHFLGGVGREPVSGMKITGLTLVADPSTQTFSAGATITDVWKLDFCGIELQQLSFEVAATQSAVGGAIAAFFRIPHGTDQPEDAQPTFYVRAEYPGGDAAEWTFSGGLEPGSQLEVSDVVKKFFDDPPALPTLTIEALDASISTGTKRWSLAGAVASEYRPTVLGKELAIRAGVRVDLSSAGANKPTVGRLDARASVNRLALELSRDIGVADPSFSIRVQFDRLWIQASTAQRGDHQVLMIQLGGATLGELLEYLVDLAAPTLGFSLEPPWDALKRIDLSAFTVTIDFREQAIEVVYTANADLVVMHLTKVTVRYEMGAATALDLSLEGTFLGQPLAEPLCWDVVNDPPPAVPGKGGRLLELGFLGVGQRVALTGSPANVAEAIALMQSNMAELKPGAEPKLPPGVHFDAGARWLLGLEASVMGTLDLAVVLSDPSLYGVSIALSGERAGSLAGLRFELLYKRISDGLGVFRAELRVPEAYRRLELGAVSVTLGLVVVEVYTNGDFAIDLGFPHNRDYQRSFTVEAFPFIGRGGLYLGVLSGATSQRVPAITNGTFSPVLELGIGLALGVGKEVRRGPLSGSISVEVEVILQGVLAWFNPASAGQPTALYHWGQGIVAIHGKLHGQIDFKVIKAALTVEASAQASVRFEAHRATLFELSADVKVEAEAEAGPFTAHFSFDERVEASFLVGHDEPAPWALAAGQGRTSPARLRRNVLPPATRDPRRLATAPRPGAPAERTFTWDPTLNVFGGQTRDVTLSVQPAFTVADPPVGWDGTAPPNAAPDYRAALLVLVQTGVAASARTAAEAAATDFGDAVIPAADLIEAVLRWSLSALRGADGQPVATVTAGDLDALLAELDDPAVADGPFSLAKLSTFLGTNLRLRLTGEPADPTERAGAMLVAAPPYLDIRVKPAFESVLATQSMIGRRYLWDVSNYMARFDPVAAPATDPPSDGALESFATHAFRDWCLLLAKTAVGQATSSLGSTTRPMGTGSLDDVAAALPRDRIAYTVRAGDTIDSVAAATGASVAELEHLNPTLAATLATALPGQEVELTIGVAGADLALENAGVTLTDGLDVVLRGVEVQVEAADTLATLATRLSQSSAAKLVEAAKLAGRAGLLRAGAAVTVPERTDPIADIDDPAQVAAILYVRYFADPQVPDASWYAQRIAELNEEVLEPFGTDVELPADLKLAVPAAPRSATTESYITLTGDSLLRIGGALSLIQAPDAYANQAWQDFRAGVVATDGSVVVPATPTTVLGGETLTLLADRLLADGVDGLLPWISTSDVLVSLALFEIDLTASTTKHTTLAEMAEAYGLGLAYVASLPEVTGRAALFPAATELAVRGLPAQTVEALAAAARTPAALAPVAAQVSRHMLSGARLPAPVAVDGVVRGSGPVTGIYEIAGLEFPTPVPDDSEPGEEALAISIAAEDPPPWLVFAEAVAAPAGSPLAVVAGDEVAGVELRYTNAQLEAAYPGKAVGVTPLEGPGPLPLAASARRTYGLDHRVELQASVPLPIPDAGGTAVAGNPSLWPFGAALLERARSASATKFDLRRGGGATDGPETVAASTFGTLVAFTVRRVPGYPNLYELAGAQGGDQELLLRLVRYVRADPQAPAATTALRLFVAPTPDAGSTSGLAVLDASTTATFAIRASLAGDAPAATVLSATLGDRARFLQLVWEAGAAGGGFHLAFATADGQDLPPGAFADDGTATLHLLAVPRQQQAAAPDGRALLPVDNCALVGPGIDPSVHALWLEMDESASDAAELVKRPLVPPGTYGVAMTLPRADAAMDRLWSTAIARLAGVDADSPPIAPQRAGQEEDVRWRYEQALPLARLGSASALPAVTGLPDPAGDPYRGFGDKSTAQKRSLALGLGDLAGNRSSTASAKAVEVPLGYTDALLGAASWPATALDYHLARESDVVTLSAWLTPRPGLAVPGPGEAPERAREAAARQAGQLAQAYYQVGQPTLSASVLTTLKQNADGSPQPVKTAEGTAPLRDHLSASYLYASAAAALEPVRPSQGATLGAIMDEYGLPPGVLARANHGLVLYDSIDPAGSIAASAHAVFAEMDTATTIRDRVPSGWPKPASAAALLELHDNANVLPLRPGTPVRIPNVTVAVADPATATLAALAAAEHTTPAWIARDAAAAAVLRPGFTFEWGEHAVTTAGLESLAQVRDAFAAVNDDVSCADLATAYADAEGILADGATLVLEHKVARAGDTLATLAGAALSGTAALNVRRPNLFEAGALVSLGAWPPQSVPTSGETLGELAERLGTTPELLVAGNRGLAVTGKSKLVLPGLATLPDTDPLVPYSVAAGDTLTGVARRFGTTAAALAEANRQLRGTLTPNLELHVPVDHTPYSVKTGPDDSLERVYVALHTRAKAAKFEDLVHAIQATPGVLRTDALLFVAAPTLAAPSGHPHATALTAAQVESAYHAGPVAFAAANAALAGLLAEGVELDGASGYDPPSVTTTATDTLNAVLDRFAVADVQLGLEELMALNPDAALYRVGARALLPPVPRAVTAELGDCGGPFATPAFPLTTSLRLERAAGAIHPDFTTDGPERRADSPVPAPAAGAAGEPLTLDAFADECLTALPNIRLATAKAKDGGADLWAVDFGSGGIHSVSVTPGATYPDGTKAPRCYALRPPYRDLWSGTAVPVAAIDDEGKLKDEGTGDFQGVDVESWARAFVADVDLFVSAPYAAGIFRDATARPALGRILRAKAKLAGALAAGLAPSVAVGAPEAARASAVAGLERRCAESLADGYDVAAVVQFDAAVESAYVGATPGARLVGLPRRSAGGSDHATLSAADTALDAAASYVEFELTLRDPEHHGSAKLAFDYVYDSLDVSVEAVSGMDGYESGTRLTFVRPLDGAYRPAAVPALSTSVAVPLPLRAHPPVPVVLEQSARPTYAGPAPPPLARAAEWTYAIAYQHEHAAQDHVRLAVTFGTSDTSSARATESDAGALARALARYAAAAPRLGDMMSWYADPPDPPPDALATVRANAAASFATLAEGVADAWAGHWDEPARSRADGAGGELSYAFGVHVAYAEAAGHDGEVVSSITLECDPPTAQPGPLGEWPDVLCRDPDGTFMALTPGTPVAGRLEYTPPKTIAADRWPAIRVEWAGLNVAAVQSGHAALAARRNEHLLDAVATNAEFLLGTDTVEAAGQAVPLLQWSDEWALAGSDLAEAVQGALDDLFASATGVPIAVGIAYGYDLAGTGDHAVSAFLPVALAPGEALAPGTGAAVAEAVRLWREKYQPAGDGARVALSISSYSTPVAPTRRRPLLTLDRLVRPLAE